MDRFESGTMLFLSIFLFCMAVYTLVAGETAIAITDAIISGILFAVWRTYRAR